MARPPEYDVIELKVPARLVLDDKKIKVNSEYIETKVRKQGNGGARISLSKKFVNKKALVFIVER